MAFNPPGYTDLLGEIATAPTGSAQWLTAQIGLTGFFINWLQAGQNDFFQFKTQVDHRFGRAPVLADIHLHYTLSSAPAAGQTIKLEIQYAWVPINAAIPLIGVWTPVPYTFNFTGAELALQHNIQAFATDILAPANQTYSSILFFKCLRRSQGGGADTYGGNLGLLYFDVHCAADRMGSFTAIHD